MTAPPPTSDPSWLPDPGSPFWKPSLADSFRYMGWKFVLSLVLFLIALAAPILFWFVGIVWFFSFWKILVTLFAAAIGMATSAIRTTLQTRREPFCIHCGYALEGLPDHHLCPECGRPYSHHLIDEYRRDPAWFVQRCRSRLVVPSTHTPFDAGPVRRRRSRDGT